VAQAGAQDGVEGLLEVTVGDAGVAVARESHLALLGHADARAQAASRLAQDRAVGRASPASHRTPTPVEEQQAHALVAAQVRELALRAVELPVRGDEAAVLVA